MRPHLGADVAAPADRVWQQLVDLDHWPVWGPTVRAARLTDGSRVLSVDATGSLQTPVGVWLPFRVERWYDDGTVRSWSWRVAGVPATDHTVTALGPDRCRVEMSVPWVAAGYLGVIGVALARIKRRADGIGPTGAE